MCTGLRQIVEAEAALLDQEALLVLHKPFDVTQLIDAVRQALNRRS